MENASGDLRRALGGPILGRQMFEVNPHAVENLLNMTHTTPFSSLRIFLIMEKITGNPSCAAIC